MINGLGIEESLVKNSADALARARHVIVFTGAGISAKPDSTQIHTDQTAQEIGIYICCDLKDFLNNPKQIWRYYNNQKKTLRKVCPSPAHYFLVELENMIDDFTLITQNTDGLHQKAGSKKLIELYGNIWTSRCTRCDYSTYSQQEYLGDEPKCPVCKNWLRPGVVWAGEPLPAEDFAAACEACEIADLMITIGTSAEVQPTASMIWQAKATNAIIIEINPTITTASTLADIRIPTLPEKAVPALVSELKNQLIQSNS